MSPSRPLHGGEGIGWSYFQKPFNKKQKESPAEAQGSLFCDGALRLF